MRRRSISETRELMRVSSISALGAVIAFHSTIRRRHTSSKKEAQRERRRNPTLEGRIVVGSKVQDGWSSGSPVSPQVPRHKPGPGFPPAWHTRS
ncbi:hypothetical protein OH77DRAFT_931569 [Trametes cingulata]|nr:hypothetical protein OH77DRAFT_931569 [Trametes cingulata]